MLITPIPRPPLRNTFPQEGKETKNFPELNDPILSELFSIERLELHGEALAGTHKINDKPSRGQPLLPRVRENGRVLAECQKRIAHAVREERAITPAAEWLLDNFHIVEDQVRQIIEDLPPGYYRELPKLAEGAGAGTPRVFALAWEFVAHTDSRFDREGLRRFTQAYQRVTPFRIGEIWALAISLRIVLLENLRRLAERITHTRTARQEADTLADTILGLKGPAPADSPAILPPLEKGALDRAFVVQLVQRLRDQGGETAPILQLLDARLTAQGGGVDDIVRAEHQEQTAMNATVRNVITSMRQLSAVDWAQFFDDVSVVNQLLRAESDFGSMDFATRDMYRHAIEELSRGSGLSELDIARRALHAAKKRPNGNGPAGESARESDPGYYLIARGRVLLEKEIHYRVPLFQRLTRIGRRWATGIYLGSIAAATGLLLVFPLLASAQEGAHALTLVVWGLLGLVPASSVAVAAINHVLSKIVKPKTLPKLDFSKGIPPAFSTMVVMPVLLNNLRSVQEHIEQLEIHYLSNPDGHIFFALLSDWIDAPTERLPDDDALLDAARAGVRRLNERYGLGPEGAFRFHLFHRRRLWSATEGVWMGWERKRGKLHELNRWLRGHTAETLIENPLDKGLPPRVRYVITLDADTRMSQGAAFRLAGAMAHPLNRPFLDPGCGRVVEGYGVMQPRMTPTLPMTGNGTLYQAIFSGPAGMDPYAFAVSDVYQDLFGEGSYVGKGIYDLDIFEAALKGRVSENAMLSHDLFEGLYARTALVTDVEFFEEFPAHEDISLARLHRWTRGDWQLLPWMIGAARGRDVRNANAAREKPLPIISQWKMIDNLRRSLVAPTAFVGLLCACLWNPPTSFLWMGFIAGTIALPPLLPLLSGFLRFYRWRPSLLHVKIWGEDLRVALWQIVLAFIFLARQARALSGAILRTLYRLLIGRRRLLEWVSAAQIKSLFDLKKKKPFPRAGITPIGAATLVGLTWGVGVPAPWSTLIPWTLLWLLAPWVSAHIRRPPGRDQTRPLSVAARRSLRRIGRKTWRYFETFVTAEHHFLPPDNFQESPHPVVAHRTSPTNIGLYLLAVAAARDFGWIGLAEMVDRLESTLSTLQKLARHQGHLFNWYDTKDLRPLDPPYVSTVDNGNLAGHLWALGNACRELAVTPFPRGDVICGLEDVLDLIEESAGPSSGHGRAGTVTEAHLHESIADVRDVLKPAFAGSLVPLREKAIILGDIARTMAAAQPTERNKDVLEWSDLLLRQIDGHGRDFPAERDPSDLLRRLAALARACDQTVQAMDFGLLFDPTKKLFFIGFKPGEKKPDPIHYDMLASEARLASFVAIAKGDVPAAHWFRLARSFAPLSRGSTLLSWSGSMFEYLMPSLVMQTPAGSLMGHAGLAVVQRQIAYGKERHVPWGVSESAFNAQDLDFTYQYATFGVPGLGLKRGLAEDLVIAPYATALAAMVDPFDAVNNFSRLREQGAEGRFGFYESLDYTPARLPDHQKMVVVRAFMAHHQGMSLVALANVLFDGVMRTRFHAEPKVRAAELLLQERLPRDLRVTRLRAEEPQSDVPALVLPVLRLFSSPHDTPPRTHLMSNGRYTVMVTAAGSGFSRWKDLAVTRWREDPTRDAHGTYIFLRDVQSGKVWSAGYQPMGTEPETYNVDFSGERAKISRRDGSIATTLEIVVSPEDDAEVRRVTVQNLGTAPRDIELTSYAEIVLALPAADLAHPAFSNLFVRTEFVPGINSLLCTRKGRDPGESSPWVAHVIAEEGTPLGPLEYECDRARFLGRGRGLRAPISVMDGKPLSNTAGAVLDPIVSLRRRVRVEPGETARITYTTLAAPSRQAALSLADKYHDPGMFERAVDLAWTQAQIQEHHLGMAPGEDHLFQEVAGRILHSNPSLRPSSDFLQRNTRGASSLWASGISGDLPIVLVGIEEPEERDFVRDILRAHEFWRMKGLEVDLVILNKKPPSYNQDLQHLLETLVRTRQAAQRHETNLSKGRIFVLRADQLSSEDTRLLEVAARVVLLSRRGSLSEQMDRVDRVLISTAVSPSFPRPRPPILNEPTLLPRLQFFNGLGGFSADGGEYVTILTPGQWTPAPWINIVANPGFGFQVSESGSGPTWALNSRENRLTPWFNDPVEDPSGESFYLRDEESGEVWTPTALPIREEGSPYISRHGQGYSQFDYRSHGIASTLLQFVPLNDPIKISRLTLTNHSVRPRRLSVTGYVEWVLGTARETSRPHLITEIDEPSGAFLAHNPWNEEFSERVAFADFAGKQTSWTGDRTEFIGRNGTLARPAALEGFHRLSGEVGAGRDPCAALQAVVFLRPGEEVRMDFFLGQGSDRAHALDLIQRYRRLNLETVLADVKKRWENDLSAVQVRTPDPSMDLLLNRWLLYQTLACRVLARTGFYQGGGAYGFRDQLQDVLALVVARRDIAREHILRAAGRQFPEGDVQHWWHPPSGRGVRTRISDDAAWLPYAVLHYLEVTGDTAIIDEPIPFLKGPPVPAGKDDVYFLPQTSSGKATLFEHCARALDLGLSVGAHGLPLIGTGDWNDGMNRVGHEGKGESVWLAWFLHTTLWEFAKVAEARGETARAEKWRLHVGDLKSAVERNGWDGEWYRRAYFDDGSPLGSAANAECRIDSIAQSWGVLSGAADPARAARAMASLDAHLVRRSEGLALLLTPPFEHAVPSPGYIQGYVPGVRENGGQYAHAAVWALLAFAELGEGDKAGELFTILNPIRRGRTRADIHRYKVEPYVTAADVYAAAPHEGRGGWTWYTGSAGWLYRAGIEWILGFRLSGTTFFMDPCIPRAWPGFELSFRYHSTRYDIKVENPKNVSRGVTLVEVDGRSARGGAAILLADDGATHTVRILLG